MGYQLLAYIHLLAAVTWLGGTLFLALVLVPATRSAPGSPAGGVAILRAAARRYERRREPMAVKVLLKETGETITGKFASLEANKVGLFSGIMSDKKPTETGRAIALGRIPRRASALPIHDESQEAGNDQRAGPSGSSVPEGYQRSAQASPGIHNG